MVSTGLEQLDTVLGGDGYPERSSILVTGPPGVGKEALGYWFMRSGLLSEDFCFYITRLAVPEVLEDFRAFRIPTDKLPFWMAESGGQLKCDVNNLTTLSANIKQVLRQNFERNGVEKRSRVVTDILSSLLMLNPADTIYRFFGQLLSESKQSNAVFVATIEEGMHGPQVLAAMQQLFDGVLELRLYEQGSTVEPLFRVRKMRGVEPRPGYFRYEFLSGKMEIRAYGK